MSEPIEPAHEYPPAYPPGVHWATDAAWEILDTVKPGLIPLDARAWLAGQIAGRLMRREQQQWQRRGAQPQRTGPVSYHPNAISAAAIADLIADLLNAHIERCDAEPPQPHIVSHRDAADARIANVKVESANRLHIEVADGPTFAIAISGQLR